MELQNKSAFLCSGSWLSSHNLDSQYHSFFPSLSFCCSFISPKKPSRVLPITFRSYSTLPPGIYTLDFGSIHRTIMLASKKSQKSSKKSHISSSSRGFGRPTFDQSTLNSSSLSPTSPTPVKLLQDSNYVALQTWLTDHGAKISKVAIADIPIDQAHPQSDNVIYYRGVVAVTPIEKGDVICSVPMDLAMNLGTDGVNPALAAANLLEQILHMVYQDFIQDRDQSKKKKARLFNKSDMRPMVDVLPSRHIPGDSTDFFSEEHLDELQCDPIVQETKERLNQVRLSYDLWIKDITQNNKALIELGPDHPLVSQICSWDSFLWGVWIVVSRVLTMQTSDQKTTKCLIPFIDMFNHSANATNSVQCNSKAGDFRIVAGADIRPGQEVTILYGGGRIGNNRLLQDYGFVEANNPNDVPFVKAQFLNMSQPQAMASSPLTDIQKDTLTKLLQQLPTTMQHDSQLLAEFQGHTHARLAIMFRMQMKKAIQTLLEK